MKRLAVLNVVGLTEGLLGEHTPEMSRFRQRGSLTHIRPTLPAVTCTAQSTYLTGKSPSEHGIVANGWYHRELAETHFWKQSNHVVGGTKIWDDLRRQIPGFTCAKLFWWYNMYASVDYSITPRPMYPADGRKFFDIYSWPYSIREEIKRDLGEFPFPTFWGPAAGVSTPQGEPEAASEWIANSARWIENKFSPTLSLVYLPHLDYNLQRLGPLHSEIPKDLKRIDDIVGGLIRFYEERGVDVLLLSEYGITPVDTPIHLNRVFRSKGWITAKEELGLELLDYGASRVFAVADHQVAHVYVKEPALVQSVLELLQTQPGISEVLDAEAQGQRGLRHSRSGDLLVIAKENAWFTYYFWMDDAKAPDFARCVDIHRKPGYDPVELFLDPAQPAVRLKILFRLLQKKLGFRMLMDVIPLDATLVKGSHGCVPANKEDYPVLIGIRKEILPHADIEATSVYDLIKRHFA